MTMSLKSLPGWPGRSGEPVLAQSVPYEHQRPHGTPDLDAWLPDQSLDGLVLASITTNHCCETTARVGGDLVHRVVFALDASHTFDRPGPVGQIVSADELSRVTAANLHGEFAIVVNTRHLVARDPTSGTSTPDD